jgi:hypothetical protein
MGAALFGKHRNVVHNLPEHHQRYANALLSERADICVFVCALDGWMNLDGTHTEAPLPHKNVKKLVQLPVRNNKLPSQKLNRTTFEAKAILRTL